MWHEGTDKRGVGKGDEDKVRCRGVKGGGNIATHIPMPTYVCPVYCTAPYTVHVVRYSRIAAATVLVVQLFAHMLCSNFFLF